LRAFSGWIRSPPPSETWWWQVSETCPKPWTLNPKPSFPKS
jgi:hypothetical protein